MKTLVVAPQPFFSPRGTPFSVYYRTMICAELGVDQDFLTYGQGMDVDIPGVRFFRTPAFRFLGHVRVGPSWLKLFHDLFIVLRMVELLARNRYACVHAHEEAVFFALLLKPIFRFKLIYDMHSSLPQQLENFQFSRFKPLVALFKRLEDRSIRASDAVITICPDLRDYVDKLLPGNDKNFLIENSIFEPVRLVGQDTARPLDEEELPVPVPASFRRWIVYAGTLESYQGIGILVRAMAQVRASDPGAGLVVVGGRPEQVEHYQDLAREIGVADAVLFTGQVSQAQARAYSQRAAVLVSPRSSGTNTPLKIYEQIASGIPLVATNIYSHSQVLDQEVAFLADPTPGALARGILEALDPEGDGPRRAANARRLYEEKYSRPAYVAKLRRVLERIA